MPPSTAYHVREMLPADYAAVYQPWMPGAVAAAFAATHQRRASHARFDDTWLRKDAATAPGYYPGATAASFAAVRHKTA
jgi:hypothetical protein